MTTTGKSSTINNDNGMDDMGLCMMVWKKRSGLGQYLSYKHPYEQRWAVLMGQKFEYFDQNNVEKARGSIDIVKQHLVVRVVVNEEEGAPTTHGLDLEFDIPSSNSDDSNSNSNTCTNSNIANNDTNATDNNSTNNIKRNTWHLCFETQEYQIQFLEFVHNVLDKGGQFVQLDKERFEHDFQPADHIFRWEMIVMPPIIYPIQIHGIVLEAGRNCVILADFGLTGYTRQKNSDFNFADDHHSKVILAQWKKLHPTHQDQRLNIVTLVDPHEIRKWTKVNYGRNFFKKNTNINIPLSTTTSQTLGKITNFFTNNATVATNDDNTTTATAEIEDDSEQQYYQQLKQEPTPQKPSKPPSSKMSTKQHQPKKQNSDDQPNANTAAADLPKSDPKKIVLARTHFLLDGSADDMLPPYHVLFSNSECIAVWCKTGRWSTLQTAVFLSTQSVCAVKSSTIATLGVAAANPLLAPVVAMGGLIYVTAPMMILKKGREKWEEATTKMTKLFWDWAPNEVYVEAIEHWSGLRNHAIVL